MDRNKMITTINKLVGYKTIKDNEDEIDKCLDYIDQELSFFPWIKKEYEKNGRKSIIWQTSDTLEPEILLYAHIDVVPASDEMFKLLVNGKKLIGRGVMDMKWAMAVYISVLKKLIGKNSLPKSLGLAVVTDEEIGGFAGSGYLSGEIGYKPKLVIMPDGGYDWKVVSEAKSASWIRLSTTGKTAHASRLWEGESATVKLIQAVNYLLKKYPTPKEESWVSTINLSGTIEGGTTPNQVADKASTIVDFRLAPRTVLSSVLTDLGKRYPEIEVEIVVHKSAFKLKKHDDYLKLWTRLIGDIDVKNINSKDVFVKEYGSADHHYWSDVGSQVIITSPVGGGIHTENEWIDLDSVIQYEQILEMYLTNFK